MHFPQCMASLTLACIFLPFEFVKSTSINLHSHSLWPRSAPLHSTPSSCALRFWRLHLRRLVLHARFHFWSWAAAAAARKYEKSSSYTRSTKKQRAWLRGAGEVAEERKKSCGSHCQLPSSVSIVCDSLGDVIRPRIFPNPKPLKKHPFSTSSLPQLLLLLPMLLPFSFLVALFAFYELPCTGKVGRLPRSSGT